MTNFTLFHTDLKNNKDYLVFDRRKEKKHLALIFDRHDGIKSHLIFDEVGWVVGVGVFEEEVFLD